MKEQQTEKNRPLSLSARQAFDSTYETIRKQSKSQPVSKKQTLKPWLMTISIAVLITIVLLGTPIGLAVGKLLGFNKFDSETLETNQFVSSQTGTVTDQNISLSLIDLYADDHEIGIHLQAILPEKHPLLQDNLTTPNMSFNLIDPAGSDLKDALIEKKWSSLNKESRTLDSFFVFTSETATSVFPEKLTEAILEVYRIGAVDTKEKINIKPGLNTHTGEFVEGRWPLTLDTSNILQFETLSYLPTEKTDIPFHQFLISPTKLMIQFDIESWEANNINFYENEDEEQLPTLIAYKGTTAKTLSLDSYHIPANENNKTYQQLIFDFGGYDAYDRFELTLPNHKTIEFQKADN